MGLIRAAQFNVSADLKSFGTSAEYTGNEYAVLRMSDALANDTYGEAS